MAQQTLMAVARQYFGPSYVPNAPAEAQEVALHVPDKAAALSGMIGQMQASGADIGAYSEDEWIDVLRGYLDVDDEHLSDYLEQIAGWGIVDVAWYGRSGE